MKGQKKIQRLLIANRGEIACRIIRTARAMDIHTIAVFSPADAAALHRHMADESYPLKGSDARESYLDAKQILALAKKCRADAVHPGYGFLSEDSGFSALLARNNLRFVGPSAASIKMVGNKIAAKKLALTHKVPLLPSFPVPRGTQGRKSAITKLAHQIGFPLLVKAASGGGGRGMRKVATIKDLESAITSAEREAAAFFGDSQVFLERFVSAARHIEVQFFGDSHGNAVHFYDRDCSLQRHHQKVIEEAPAPGLSNELRQSLYTAALTLARAARYCGAGTAEFLVDEAQNFYFLEINSRLQVEHPVTEAITCVDLVRLQLEVACGYNLKKLPSLPALANCGAAIEARLCAEDPTQRFAPATGKLEAFDIPVGDRNIRVDTGFRSGDSISHYYDSLLAKLIVHGASRNEAISTLQSLLSKTIIGGVASNSGYLLTLLALPEFKHAAHHIQLAQSHVPSEKEHYTHATVVAACSYIHHLEVQKREAKAPWDAVDHFRVTPAASMAMEFSVHGRLLTLALTIEGGGKYQIHSGRSEWRVQVIDTHTDSISVSISDADQIHAIEVRILRCGSRIYAGTKWGSFEIETEPARLSRKNAEAVAGLICSPLPGKIISVLVQEGELMAADALGVLLESMKMEHAIRVPRPSLVHKVYVAAGQVVKAGEPLFELSAAPGK